MDGNEAKYTDSFSLPELPQAMRAIQLASEWVERHEAELSLSES